jgi:hypothetical protein
MSAGQSAAPKWMVTSVPPSIVVCVLISAPPSWDR